MKDLFSTQSEAYARFRPRYPDKVYEYLYSLIPHKNKAWDAGTGNGQVAALLAESFNEVYATDISQQQLEQAIQKENIFYRVEKAEQTSFPDHTFDLVTVAQAIHWFDFDRFYTEVKRVITFQGVFAVLGYDLLGCDPAVDAVINHLYKDILGPYWEKERVYIDEQYQTIPFPFEEFSTPSFVYEVEWDLDHLMGYLNTWSAVQKYTQKKGENPITKITKELQKAWGTSPKKQIRFPVLLRVGKVLS